MSDLANDNVPARPPADAGGSDTPSRQQRLLEDALRLADWIGGLQGLPWYRDERGRLIVPREFPAAEDGRLMADPHAFPLAYLIPEADRPRINGQYRAALRGGGVFDDCMQLRDATGALRNVRVVCMTRAPRGSGAVHMIIGTIAEARAGAASAVREAAGDLLARLPVLVWIVDDQGRVVHAQGNEPRRWGVRAAPSLRPQGDEAFEFKPRKSQQSTRYDLSFSMRKVEPVTWPEAPRQVICIKR